MISVCASRDASPTKGYLQYRTGKPDSTDPLDLTLPSAMSRRRRPPRARACPSRAAAAHGCRVATKSVGFVLFTGIGKWGPRGEIQEKAGVAIERDGKQVASLKCTGKPISLLGPDYFEKVGIKSKGQDFDFPD